MNKICWFVVLMIGCCKIYAQTIEQKLQTAVAQLQSDSQMRHAILGFAVADARTGKIIFERNSQVGLAPASTQKIFTSITSFELLGKDYRYKTELAYAGDIEDSVASELVVKGYGDPTFGSWRYATTKPALVTKLFADACRKKGIRSAKFISVDDSRFDIHVIPDGWIWQDIGNYYGTGSGALNWRENQYDLVLEAGNTPGTPVKVSSTNLDGIINLPRMINELKTGAKGSGDNAYIYLPPYGAAGYLKGTIPAGEKKFTISGALPYPAVVFGTELKSLLSGKKGDDATTSETISRITGNPPSDYNRAKIFYTYYSPTLDSINYYFMRRSINMYGEALVKTIAYEKTGYGSTDTGVSIVRDFWASKGIEKTAVNIMDGSGLSPQNRVTADALVKALLYAKTRPWYASFYEGVPSYNGMKLKSGSIGGARAFAGYHIAANGKEYVTAILVNNYSGSSGEIVKKMYKVLDVLK